MTVRIPISRRYMWLVVLIVGAALFVVTRLTCQITGNPHLWPAYLFVGALIVPATVVSLADGMSADSDVGPVYLVVIATVGGVVGVVLAGLGEYGLQVAYGELPRIAIAVIEEASKLIIPLVALLLVRRDAANGLIIGMAAGGGFAVIETLGYSGAAIVHAGNTLSDVDDILWERGLFAPATHIAWTGLAGCALGYAFQRRWSLAAILVFLGAFGSAVLLHSLWDSSNTGGYLLLSALSVFGVCALAYFLGVRGVNHDPTSPDRST
ncbi:PrsW family glutamic-type intramembrane protease [Nakamurella sp.]|uniref:PrsW family glutamic-type intramembrane protease n=1 Tax=Nakamurella sp. TaxID=1869182 RepID=UPI003783424E